MPLTSAQLKRRQTGVGASDAGNACGLGYKSPLQLWGEKTGRLPLPDLDNNRFVKWGNRLEKVVCDAFAEETGLKIRRNAKTLRHPDYPWMLCHLDREIVDTDGNAISVLEAKTGSFYTLDKWGPTCDIWSCPDDYAPKVPDEYFCQAQHQLAVTGLYTCYIAVLLAGNDFRVFVIARDDAFIANLIRMELRLMEHIWADTMPDNIDWDHATTIDTLKGLYAGKLEGAIELDMDGEEAHFDYQAAASKCREFTKLMKNAQGRLLASIGSAEIARTPDGGRYLRTHIIIGPFTNPGSEYDKLTFSKKG
jgi:putative phage-type endonuclease